MKIWVFLLVCGLAYASAVRYEDDDDVDIDDIDLDKEPGGLGQRLRERLERSLERVKARLEKNKDLAADFGDRVKEIAKHIATIGKEANRKTLETVRIINRKIADLTRDILRKIGSGKFKRAIGDLMDIAINIKIKLMTPDGYHEFKRHIVNLRSDHPVLQILQSYVMAADDDDLKAILKDLLMDIPSAGDLWNGIAITPRPPTDDFEELFVRLAEIMKTDDGFDQVYDYFLNLKPTHPVVVKLQMVLQTVDKDMVKEILGELISALEY